jgi:hypothetical protein
MLARDKESNEEMVMLFQMLKKQEVLCSLYSCDGVSTSGWQPWRPIEEDLFTFFAI